MNYKQWQKLPPADKIRKLNDAYQQKDNFDSIDENEIIKIFKNGFQNNK